MGKKKQKIGGGAGGLRPRRQRTQVQHYTDDIPGTFTKKKKRRRSDGSGDSSGSDSDESAGHHPQMYDQRRTIHFDEFASLEDNTAAAVKEAKKNKRKIPPTAAAEATTSATASTIRNDGISSNSNASSSKKSNNKQPKQPFHRPRKLEEMPPPTPPKTTMLSHTASVAPILPLASTCPLARHSLAQQYPIVYGRGLGTPQPPAQPEWHLVANHEFYFPEDYLQIKVSCTPISEEDEPRTSLAPVLQNGPWPVCRVVTTVCSFSNWMAVGDSAGFILIFSTGPTAIRLLTRLDTSASKREWARQRKVQAEVENRCRHKPELLEKRSPFWATAKTPNAIQCMTWSQKMILILTAQEIEAIQLSPPTSTFESFASTYKGGSSYCRILWTLPVATVGGPRKIGSNSLLTGGELVGSYLELNKRGTMVLWNTWGVAVDKKENSTVGDEEAASSNGSEKDQDRASVGAEDDWPLMILRDTRKDNEFVRIIPFQRQEEEEKPPPMPIKRSPGRPPKKKPKPKIPVSKSELVWTEQSKCHAAMWDNHPSKGDRLVIAYSTTSTLSAGDAQVLLTLLKLTDDIGEDDTALPESTTATKPQFARLLKQIAVPLVGSARNVANVPEVTLQQSAKGTYTLVAGSRGVRMYETGTMSLLRVYGENVSLHGKTMVWKSCFVLDNRLQQQLYREQERHTNNIPATQQDDNDGAKGKTIARQNRQGFAWLEQENPLAAMLDRKDTSNSNSSKILTRRRTSTQRIRTSSSVDEHEDEDQDDDDSHWLHQAWIVGIPHPFRGPKELQETLYFWQGIEKLPLFTAPLPHQSGGAQSILPLISPCHSSNRKDGMWLRLMVATVHGECMQLTPRVRSDFAGIMYNPGYFVVQENVEYIEDEDELDKVMVEMEEEKDEPEEEVAPPPLGTEVAGEIVDEELQEAIRLSLLESQGKSKASAESDEDCDETVVVQDFFGEDDDELVIPCEPEPFLRQKLLPEFESDSMMIIKDTANADISAKDAEFASEILSILPQSNAAQERWDTQKDVSPPENIFANASQFTQPQTPTANGCGNASASAFPGKSIGKSKRSRAGNLEMMMKASLWPDLRQYMTDRSLCWADGSGSRLQVDAWDNTISKKKESEKEAVESPPVTETETSKEPEPEKDLQDMACDGTDGRTPAGSSSETDDGMRPSTESSKGDARPAASGAALSVRAPEASRADMEKEIALELLQLSPRPTASASPGNTPPELDIKSQKLPPQIPLENTKAACGANENEPGAMKVAIIELKDYSGSTEQYSCTGTVDIPLTLEECGLPAVDVEEDEEPIEPVLDNQQIDETGVLATTEREEMDEASKKPLEKGKEATKVIESSKNRTNVASVEGTKTTCKLLGCAACQGRMVIHTCGKRALPIDFEAIARQEKEQKEREEEEKKRLKIEKRKQADAKRREAKKQKKEREKREKMEKAEELRRIQAAKIAEARANMANIGDCLETGGSPPLNGLTENGGRNLEVESVKLPKAAIATANNATVRGGDTIHFAIADAWKEHADKFTAKTDSATEKSAATESGGWENGNSGVAVKSNTTDSNTLDALATMAEAATPQLETPLRTDKQTGVLETTGPTAAVPSTPNHTPPQTAEQQTQHGFLRSPEGSATSAAMIARRNQVLNSYHAMEARAGEAEPVAAPGSLAGGGAAAARPRVVDLSNQRQSAFNPGDGRAHSFQISPMSNPAQPLRVLGQPNLSVFQRHTPNSAPSAAPRSSQPYFGYTQLSSHFRPRVNLGSYSSATIFTAHQRQPQPGPAVTTTVRTENPVPAPQAPVVAPNRDSYFPGSQPQPAAAVALVPPPVPPAVPPPRAAPTAVSASNPIWMNPARALAQAMSVPGTMLVQPQLGSALAPAGQIAAAAAAGQAAMNPGGMASAQYHQRLHAVQPAAASPAAAPINPHVNSVVYNKPTTTTNP